MTIEVALLISVVSLCVSAYLGFKGAHRTDAKDIEERAKENAMINFKLDNIGQTTKDIRADISSLHNEIKVHNDRLIKVEESLKSAHKRISTLEDRVNGGEYHERENKETA